MAIAAPLILFFENCLTINLIAMSSISKSDLENALDKIEGVLDKYGIAVPHKFNELRNALDKAEKAYRKSPNNKDYPQICKEVEDLRREVTNSINEEYPDWQDEARYEIGEYDDEPRFVIDPLNSMEFRIDPDELD